MSPVAQGLNTSHTIILIRYIFPIIDISPVFQHFKILISHVEFYETTDDNVTTIRSRPTFSGKYCDQFHIELFIAYWLLQVSRKHFFVCPIQQANNTTRSECFKIKRNSWRNVPPNTTCIVMSVTVSNLQPLSCSTYIMLDIHEPWRM